jgi:photosystem II stability/assembly factor-like uncharacterized protein
VRGIYKSTDGGTNWESLNAPVTAYLDMSILNNDTIWIVTPESFAGGVFFTSNGGASWQQQFSGGNQNPNKIYMYNARLGFMSNTSGATRNIYKTSNAGMNWIIVLPGEYFYDMYFTDSLTGWKCMPGSIAGDSCVKKTTNGGINWFKQSIPLGGMLISSQIQDFGFINKDTIWGAGGAINYNGVLRGILYHTTNGGINWGFQVPDTSFGIGAFGFVQFINKNTGWALGQLYNSQTYRFIHTTNGGDTTFLVGIQQVSAEVPKQFKLFQNYPNPFNPKTNIKYQISNNNSYVQIEVFDVTGRNIISLVNQKQNAGTYEIDFSGNKYSSGVYFYKLIIGGVSAGVKTMILLK